MTFSTFFFPLTFPLVVIRSNCFVDRTVFVLFLSGL